MSNLVSLEEGSVCGTYKSLVNQFFLLKRTISLVLKETKEVFEVGKNIVGLLGGEMECEFLDIVKLFGGMTFVGSVMDINNTFFELLKESSNQEILSRLEETGSDKKLNLFNALRLVAILKKQGFFEVIPGVVIYLEEKIDDKYQCRLNAYKSRGGSGKIYLDVYEIAYTGAWPAGTWILGKALKNDRRFL